VHVVEVGEAAHGLLPALGGVGLHDAGGEHLQVAYPALDVRHGERVRLALRVEHDRHLGIVEGDAGQDVAVAAAQRRQPGQPLGDVPQVVGQHRGDPDRVDELLADHVRAGRLVGRQHGPLPGLPRLDVQVLRRANVVPVVKGSGVVHLVVLAQPREQRPDECRQERGRVHPRLRVGERDQLRHAQPVLAVVLAPVHRDPGVPERVGPDWNVRVPRCPPPLVGLGEPQPRLLGHLWVDHNRVDAQHVTPPRPEHPSQPRCGSNRLPSVTTGGNSAGFAGPRDDEAVSVTGGRGCCRRAGRTSGSCRSPSWAARSRT
jgi:hypothetical protein